MTTQSSSVTPKPRYTYLWTEVPTTINELLMLDCFKLSINRLTLETERAFWNGQPKQEVIAKNTKLVCLILEDPNLNIPEVNEYLQKTSNVVDIIWNSLIEWNKDPTQEITFYCNATSHITKTIVSHPTSCVVQVA